MSDILRIVFLAAFGLYFLIWVGSVLRVLFAIRRRTSAKIGSNLPGPLDTLSGWGDWLRNPEFQQERRRLMWMTITVFALAYLFSFVVSSTP